VDHFGNYSLAVGTAEFILRKGATALETVAPNLNVVTVLTPATT